MAMKRIAAMLLASVLLLSCVGCAQDGRKEPDAEKTDLGLTAEVKPATDFTAKANAAVYDELDFDDKQEYEFATRGLVDAPETLELKDEDGTILWSQEAYAFLDDYEKAPDSVNPSLWENTKNNHAYGLFEVTDGIYQVRGYDMANLTVVKGKTAKSILISCGARLAPFDIPQLREIMSYDELELDRMGDRRTATFFCISDTDSTYNFLVALAFSQMFNLLCERADNVHGGRLPHHVRVLWDEAANTGQVPNLEKLVAVIRSREISLCLLYQQLAQCKAIYDKNAETILGNMDSVLFLGGREASTIKEISENWLGKATISMQTEGRSRGQSESYSQNTQRLGRELMTPSELATMPGDRCILQLRGLPPFYSKKYDLKQHPNYRFTAEADKVKNAFDLDRLIDRHRRPGMNEECEVYEVSVPDEAITDEDEDILNYDDLDDPDAFV